MRTLHSPLILILFALALGAEDQARQAEAILESLDRPVGLVHLPRCGDGALGLALLAADEKLRVHGQDTDYAQVQAARRQADEQGVAGRRAWFDHGDVSRLLPVGNSSDLIVMSGLTSGDLTPALAKEVTRVLHPWYGVALLAGEVPPAAMARWAAEFDGLGLTATVVSRQEDAALATAFPGALQWEQETDIKRRRYVPGFAGDTILRHPVAGWAMGGERLLFATKGAHGFARGRNNITCLAV